MTAAVMTGCWAVLVLLALGAAGEPFDWLLGAHRHLAGPADLLRSPDLRRLAELRPGGVLIAPAGPQTLSGLRRVARMSPDQPGGDPWRRVKLGALEGGEVALFSKGLLDDSDHFCLGDYGNEYGEYRWGVFSRFIQRMLGRSPPALADYFERQAELFRMPVAGLRAAFKFPHRTRDGRVVFRYRTGERREMTVEQLRAGLASDLQFALAVHSERLSVELEPEGWLRVSISGNTSGLEDYRLHPKQQPWTSWRAYFGDAQAQHLIVIAQTLREKALMVDDDLSDLYRGQVTAAVPEGAVSVSLISSHCASFGPALALHKIDCVAPTDPAEHSTAGEQSPLYALAAKEKLSGDLGAAAESSLKTIAARAGRPWPNLAVLHLESGQAALELFEGRELAHGRLRSLARRLHHGVDLVHVHSCALPPEAVDVLVPGGLVLVEGLDCLEVEAFEQFVGRAQQVGHLAIGRGIAVIVKHGEYKGAQAERTRWPHVPPRPPSKLEL